MYGDEALKLVREAKRAQAAAGSTLSVYNETVVRNVIKELQILADEQSRVVAVIQHAVDEDPYNETDDVMAAAPAAYRAQFLLHHAGIERNKRCLLAYHAARIDKVRGLTWELGGAGLPPDVARRCSPAEARFAEKYAELLTSFKGVHGSIDLTAAPVPPKELYICVRVVKDCGEIFTETGQSLVLKANTQHFVRRTDVERLITQGYLVHVE
ncbi:DNA replication protein psf1 [Allomyces javanicus]|nr:DNA replication protein psf1 [Allomyces javanicus]